MTKLHFIWVFALNLVTVGHGQTVYWNFDSETPAANSAPNVMAGIISRGNGGSGSF